MTTLGVRPWADAGAFDAAAPAAEFQRAGLPHYEWANGPHDRYGEHTHAYDKTLVCLEGSIVFHVPGRGDLALARGDRLDLPAGTPHAATVGPRGVRCVEAHHAG